MALIPTTWDPSTKEPTAYLSGGDLVYSTDNYYANIVTSVASAVVGRWYWETTLDVFVPGAAGQFGAITNGVENGLGRDWQLGSPVQGDVLGFALDIGAGTIEFFKNGASVRLATGLEANPGETWKAYLQLASPPGSGETVSATTNFGASAFVHPAPTGFNAGFGTVDLALEVAGIAAEGAGTPVCTVEVKTVGIEADGAGTPGIFQRVLVPGIQSQGAGKTTLATDRKVQVYGTQSAGAGIPQLVIVAPGPALPRLRVVGIEAAGAGGPGSSGQLSAAVTGLSSQGPGAPTATSWHAVQGIELVGLGAVSATAKYLVAPGAGAQGCGSVSSRIAVYPAGIEAPGVGSARFVGISRHFIAGLLATGAGTPSASTTFRVSPVPAPPGAGMPALRPTPC